MRFVKESCHFFPRLVLILDLKVLWALYRILEVFFFKLSNIRIRVNANAMFLSFLNVRLQYYG